jgi:diguanylate cyclase (GGDEF)-like protein
VIGDLKLGDEEGRLRTLRRYALLDSNDEKQFETIIELVQEIVRVPICAVSLVDNDRQWFKARRGLSACETSRNISFCTHTIETPDHFMIANAGNHPLTKANPLVTGEPNIQSYLGVPLTSPDGYNIGALCVIDTKPREFGFDEIAILKKFAHLLVELFELRQIAAIDSLTGALSRGAWTARALMEIGRAGRYTRPVSLLIFDIDNFKQVNDRFGHSSGDYAIIKLARIAMEGLRQSDIFGRYGGEEFVLLMPETESQGALVVAERIRRAFAAFPATTDNDEMIECTISVGIAQRTIDEPLDALLNRADRALYQAKREGRNRTKIDSSVLDSNEAEPVSASAE